MLQNDVNIDLPDGVLFSYQGRVIDFGDGEMALIREPLEWVAQPEDDFYTVKAFDRLDVIAFNAYNKYTPNAHFLYWIIGDANLIENPMDLTEFVGTDIIIPNYLSVKLIIEQQQ